MTEFGDYFWYMENDEGSITIGITDDGLEETGDVHQIVLAEEDETFGNLGRFSKNEKMKKRPKNAFFEIYWMLWR